MSGAIAPSRVSRRTPAAGRIAVRRVADGLPAAGRLSVVRVADTIPRPGSRGLDAQDDRAIGETGYGKITIGDGVVAAIASRAVLDVDDAGGVAPSVLGHRLAGGRLGVRETSLDSLPKTSATVDGETAFVRTTVSVRWPAPIASVANAVRDSIRDRVEQMTAVTVAEVEVHVAAVAPRPAAKRRVL